MPFDMFYLSNIYNYKHTADNILIFFFTLFVCMLYGTQYPGNVRALLISKHMLGYKKRRQ